MSRAWNPEECVQQLCGKDISSYLTIISYFYANENAKYLNQVCEHYRCGQRTVSEFQIVDK